jgi:hypothetical protein
LINSTTSDVAALTVTPDTEPPVLVSAASLDGTSITLCFNEPLDGSDAVLTDNFSYTAMDPGNPDLSVGSASLRADGRSIQLNLEGTAASPIFNLRVAALRDVFGNTMADAVEIAVTNFGLTGLDLGALNPSGTNVACSANTIQVTGGGLDVAGTADQLRFVYRTVPGDFDARVRVASLTGVPDHLESTAKALLLARANGSDANASSFSAFFTPLVPADNSAGCLVRTNAGGPTGALGVTSTPPGLPDGWLRIRRVGDLFTSYRSANGVDWVTIGSITLAYGPSAAVGIGVTSHRNGRLVTGTFNDFQISQIASEPTLINSSFIAGVFSAAFQTQNGFDYSVEYKDDLNAPLWSPLPPVISGDGTLKTFTDPGPANTQRFYRVTIP